MAITELISQSNNIWQNRLRANLNSVALILQPRFLLMRNIGLRSRYNGPLVRYVKLRVVHAPGMPWTFSPQPRFSDPDRHHGTCVTHVLWCMPGSLTSSLLWSPWWGKLSRHSRRRHNQQCNVSGKKPNVSEKLDIWITLGRLRDRYSLRRKTVQ